MDVGSVSALQKNGLLPFLWQGTEGSMALAYLSRELLQGEDTQVRSAPAVPCDLRRDHPRLLAMLQVTQANDLAVPRVCT